MLIIRNLKLPLNFDFENCDAGLIKALKLKENEVTEIKLHKKSLDCRMEDNIHFNCSVTVKTNDDKLFIKRHKALKPTPFKKEKYRFPKRRKTEHKVVITGFGPAGIFAAYLLALAGFNPLVIEQGEDVDSRTKTVEEFHKTNKLNPLSNVQFGEGGAGTFSDGKLNTGINDPRISAVLETFVKFGAKKEILYENKAHIGTDFLVDIIKNMRNEIIRLGGEIHFSHRLTGIKISENRVVGVSVENGGNVKTFECDSLILATGHSARETYEMLKKLSVPMSPKPFAMGVRIEHKQSDINKAQYKSEAENKALGSADYKLSVHLENGRGVFTFCMCPGGFVVNASSEEGAVAVNGMSYSARDGENANSALLVGVSVDDFYKGDVLDGIYLQREIEQKAFEVGKGYPVCQTVGDLLGINSSETVLPTVRPKATKGDICDVLPKFITDSIKEALPLLDKKLTGFATPDAILTCPESRSSSPVRIERNEVFESKIKGLYPCGEGAGYAGGIMSAAVDGMKVAEVIINKTIGEEK